MTLRWLIILITLLSPLSAAFSASAIPVDIQKIIERGKITVALYKIDVPPFFYHDATGKLIGYDVELANYLAAELGVKIEFLRDSDTFDDVVTEIAQGKADIAISLLSRTSSRALYVNFTNPYLLLPQALLYNRLQAAQLQLDNPAKQIKNRKDIVVGVLAKSSYASYIKDMYPHSTIASYSDIDKGMRDVETGKIFGLIFNLIDIQTWLSKTPKANLYVKYQLIDRKDPIAIAVSWDSPNLVAWINIFLDNINFNGTLTQLKKTYFKADNE